MPKATKVDQELLLKQLLEDSNKPREQRRNESELATQFDVSRQRISQLKVGWIRGGKLPEFMLDTSGRKKTVTGHRHKGVKPADHRNGAYEWTDVQEAVLRMAQQAKGAEVLADENWQQKNRIATLEELNAQLQRKLQEISGSQQAYDLLIKQGEIPTPLIRGKK